MFNIGQEVFDTSVSNGPVGVVVERCLKVKWPDGTVTFLSEDDASVGGVMAHVDPPEEPSLETGNAEADMKIHAFMHENGLTYVRDLNRQDNAHGWVRCMILRHSGREHRFTLHYHDDVSVNISGSYCDNGVRYHLFSNDLNDATRYWHIIVEIANE